MLAAVFAGSDVAYRLECPRHVALVVESDFLRNFRDEFVGGLQQLAGGVDPGVDNISSR